MGKKLTPFRIALLYLLAGILWISISDELLLGLIGDPQLISTFQTYKGLLYMIVTALLLYGVINKLTASLDKTKNVLRSERERFEMASRVCSDVVWDWNVKHDTLWWSEGYESKFGYEIPDESEGIDTWYRHLYPEDQKQIEQKVSGLQNYTGKFWKTNYRYLTADGSVLHIKDRSLIIRDEEGEVIRMVGAMVDVTREKEAQEALRESEQYYRNIFESNPHPMWIYDPATQAFIMVNQAAINHYGYSKEEFLSMTIADIFTPKRAREIKNTNFRDYTDSTSYYEEMKQVKKDGTIIIVNISAADIPYGNKTYRQVQIFDITEQKKVREQVINSLVEGEDRERRRVARELHDGLGQYLVAASMNMESIKDDIAALPSKRVAQFKKGLSLLKQSLTETRNIAYKLMPQVIEDYGLVSGIENLVDDFRGSTTISFTFEYDIGALELGDPIEINLYRLVQEAVQNAVKHAGCDEIYIGLFYVENILECIIEDNGKGMEAGGSQKTNSFGLQNIRTRANVLNGELKIYGRPGKGTRITVRIPDEAMLIS